VIHGREADLAAIDNLLAGVRLRRSATLVLEGEAGIGKTALLHYAVARSDDLQVLTASGSQSEAELAFAALHQLLWPLLPEIDRLSAPQANALRSAFGLTTAAAGGPDRFLVGAATLTLLADAAESRPVLCVVDDLQWVDGPTADALRFVARRIHAEGIGLLAATRAVEGQGPILEEHPLGSTVPVRRLGGLPAPAAVELVAQWHSGALTPAVARELIERVGGSPLALREIPQLLTPEQRVGREPLPDPLPVGPELNRAFLHRFQALPQAAQRLLEVAAADAAADLATVRGVAGTEVGPDVDPAERAGLVRVTETRLEFTHPLLRSAIYGAMPTSWRSDVHRALADAMRTTAPDRSAWHLAAASGGPDAAVAQLLESTADRARRRSGYAAAATAMARAAELSTTTNDRARRLVRAAGDAWSAGQTGRSHVLLDRTARIDGHDQAAVAHLRGQFQLRAGLPAEAVETLLEGSRHSQEPLRSLEMLMAAAEAASYAGDPARMALIGGQAVGLPAENDRARYLWHVLSGTAALLGGDQQRGMALLGEAEGLASSLEEPAYLRWGTYTATYVGSPETDRRFVRLVQRLRDLGAIGDLPSALQFAAVIHALTGHFDRAMTEAGEGLQLAMDTGQESSVGVLLAAIAVVAALRGEEAECRRHADEALTLAEPRRQGMAVAFATWALGLLELTLGHPDRALEHHEKIARGGPGRSHPAIAASSLGWHVEAAVQAGHPDIGLEALERLAPWVEHAGPYYRPMLAFCRARLTDGPDATSRYEEALSLSDGARDPFTLTYRHFAYGQYLRRQRQRSEARIHLREALTGFERLGSRPWTRRAQDELRATGETARRSGGEAPVSLTPQETQITALVVDGFSNREIAAQLFLSPRTVEYHLRKVFQKLGITSRTELIRAGGPVPTTTTMERSPRR